MEWLHYLKQWGVSVAVPYHDKDGHLMGILQIPEGQHSWCLFEYAPGQPASVMSEPQNFHFGEQIARIHQVSDQYTSPHFRGTADLDFLSKRPLKQIASCIQETQNTDFCFIEELCLQWEKHQTFEKSFNPGDGDAELN